MITGRLVDYKLDDYRHKLEKQDKELSKIRSDNHNLKRENSKLKEELRNIKHPIRYNISSRDDGVVNIYRNAYHECLDENKSLREDNAELRRIIFENLDKYAKLKLKHKKAARMIAHLKNVDNTNSIKDKYYRIKNIILKE